MVNDSSIEVDIEFELARRIKESKPETIEQITDMFSDIINVVMTPRIDRLTQEAIEASKKIMFREIPKIMK